VRTVPRLCEFYLGFCLTTEEKARKNLSQGNKNLSVYYLPGGVFIEFFEDRFLKYLFGLK